MITIHINDHGAVKDILATVAHLPRDIPAALARALNRTLRDVRREAVRLARTTYTARTADLARKSTLSLAKRGALTGAMTMADARGMGLVNFRARPGKPGSRPEQGTSVHVLRSGGRKTPRKGGQKAFVARGRGGNTHLFVRTKPGKGGMQALYGPHPIQAFGREENESALERIAEEALPRNLQQEIDAVLARSVKGRR